MSDQIVIGIDGDQGAGKSEMATEIERELGHSRISLDCCLDKSLAGQGSYVSQIDLAKLRTRIASLEGKQVVVEGVLLLDVLERVNITPDFLIFAKSEKFGSWEYARYLAPSARLPKHPLTREIAEYYRRRQPFSTAHFHPILHWPSGI